MPFSTRQPQTTKHMRLPRELEGGLITSHSRRGHSISFWSHLPKHSIYSKVLWLDMVRDLCDPPNITASRAVKGWPVTLIPSADILRILRIWLDKFGKTRGHTRKVQATCTADLLRAPARPPNFSGYIFCPYVPLHEKSWPNP